MLADLEVVERRLERLEASIKKQRKEAEVREQELLGAAQDRAGGRDAAAGGDARRRTRSGCSAASPSCRRSRSCTWSTSRRRRSPRARGWPSATASARWRRGRRRASGWVSAVIEAEIARLEGEEQQAFLADLGLAEPAINRVLRECFALLGLVSFFTTGEDEVRAWPIPAGHPRPGRRRHRALRHRARLHPGRGQRLRRAGRRRRLVRRPARRRASSGWRARTTWCATARSATSGSTSPSSSRVAGTARAASQRS